MTSERLFGSNIRPACKYCERVLQEIGDKMLCSKKGVVLSTNKCRKFIYNPLMRVPPKPRPVQKFEKSDFEL